MKITENVLQLLSDKCTCVTSKDSVRHSSSYIIKEVCWVRTAPEGFSIVKEEHFKQVKTLSTFVIEQK